MNKRILKKILLLVAIELKSPLCIASGEEEYTDKDVLMNGRGEYFIPGSSIAGAFRGYLGYRKDQEKGSRMFGHSDGEDGKMSRLFISDGIFSEKYPVCTTRDGIRLDDEKIVIKEKKYDYQILETGAQGCFSLELVIRDGDDEELSKKEISSCLRAMNRGEIRLGSKKSRGLGWIGIRGIRKYEIGGFALPNSAAESIQEQNGSGDETIYEQKLISNMGKELALWNLYRSDPCEFIKENSCAECKDEWLADILGVVQPVRDEANGIPETKYIDVTVPLNLKGPISINRYHARKGEPDHSHLTCNHVPVVPGSSWNGALRSRMKEILRENHEKTSEQAEIILEEIFGYVREGKDRKITEAQRSSVVIDESILEGEKELVVMRNKVSRFDASTRDGALFQELTYADRKTSLVVHLRKDKNKDYEWKIGLLLLAIRDLQEGLLPVGGNTSVGRGVFSKDRAIQFSEGTMDCYLGAYIKKFWGNNGYSNK